MNSMIKCLFIATAIFILFLGLKEVSTVSIVNPRTELLLNPLGIDALQPSLSWELISNERGQKQTAYQLLVASTEEKLNQNIGDLWNSEKIVSDKSTFVKYEGKELASGQQCFWKVKIWDVQGHETEWSKAAMWSMGLLNSFNWKATWVGLDKLVGVDDTTGEKRKLSARYLRKEFFIEKSVKRATAYICGLGLNELYINGVKISDEVLSPGLTQYDKRSFYVTYDVTKNINIKKNTVGVILGNGRYFAMRKKDPAPMVTFGFPKLLLQMDVEFSDGTHQLIISDPTWKLTTDGPIIENNEYDGEVYDARKEMKGWNENGFDDSKWMNTEPVGKSSPVLNAQMIEPIRITEKIKPLTVSEVKPGVFVYDMGQNIVGWIRLNVSGSAGQTVKLRFAETLQQDGNLYTANLRGASCTDYYTLKGEGQEVWEPRFVYHGFRFVELTGFPGKADLTSILGCVVHDDVQRTGQFMCSSEMMNKIFTNASWGMRGNYRSIPTDCPQRDERQGWLGDRANNCFGESFIFGINRLYTKWIVDICDEQRESGSISDVCPAYWAFYNDNVTWAGTPVLIAKMLYQQYGDLQGLQKSYPFLKKWMLYMKEKYMKDDLMPRDSYGDWCTPPEKPELIHSKDTNRVSKGDYIGSAAYFQLSNIMHDFALLLQLPDDAKLFDEQAKKIKDAINKKYWNATTKTYSNNTATASILALYFGLAPKENIPLVMNNLIDKIEKQHEGHIPTGLVGTQYLMRTLTYNGRADIAYRFATETTYPSWGYTIKNGATTIWELWNGNTADPSMNSGNHVMLLGDYNVWLFEEVAGIKSDPNMPGFKHIIMHPDLTEQLSMAKATYNSLYGDIISAWKKEGTQFSWKIKVPVNTTATISIPAISSDQVKEGGKNIADVQGVKFVKMTDGKAIYNIESGSYSFSSSIVKR